MKNLWNGRMAGACLAVTVAIATPWSAGDAAAQSTVQVRGLVDMVGQDSYDEGFLNSLNTGDGAFDPLRARLFVEGAHENTEIYLQFLFSQESFARVRFFGGYLMHRVGGGERLIVQAGLVPVNLGIWAPHTYSNRNPLVGIPLQQYWKSNLSAYMIPNDLDDLLSKRGQGQFGFEYADSNGTRGSDHPSMPLLYDNCWNYGLFAMGFLGRFEYNVGLTLGTPAAPMAEPDRNDNLTVNAKLGYAFTPGLKAWISGARGAYLVEAVAPYLPAGKSVNDYYQNVLGLSMDWKWNHLWMMGEFFWNHFDTPVREDGLSNTGFYAQAVYKLFAQWDVSLRYDELRFEKVEDGAGNSLTWDYNVYRTEAGVTYRVSRNLRVKGVVQATDAGHGWKSDNVIPALQASFVF